MNIGKKHLIVMLACLCCFMICCTLKARTSSTKYYNIEMFDSIVINESTLADTAVIAPDLTLTVTSFGAIGEIPTKNGQYIQIRFVGSELVVCSIEIKDTPWCDK